MFRACVKICVEIKCIKSSPCPLKTFVVSDRGQGGCGERQRESITVWVYKNRASFYVGEASGKSYKGGGFEWTHEILDSVCICGEIIILEIKLWENKVILPGTLPQQRCVVVTWELHAFLVWIWMVVVTAQDLGSIGFLWSC